MENQNNVSLTISKEIVTPIVQTKIQEAVLSAMGGADVLIKKVVDQIITQKVDEHGKVNSYSSSNKFSWLDIVVTQQIKEALEIEIREQITKSSASIRAAIVSQLQTKKGANLVASAMLDGLNDTFKSNWSSRISVKIEPKQAF